MLRCSVSRFAAGVAACMESYAQRTKSAEIPLAAPIGIDVVEGEKYWWCTCGKSKNQPWCDGSHEGSDFAPAPWTATESRKVYVCACKHTKNAPFCDGSHVPLKTKVTPKPKQ